MAGEQGERAAKIAKVRIRRADSRAHAPGMRFLELPPFGTSALPQILILDFDPIEPDVRKRTQQPLGRD